MKEAIQDYRVNSDDSDHESEVNDAVEGIQETVRETSPLSFCTLPCICIFCHSIMQYNSLSIP